MLPKRPAKGDITVVDIHHQKPSTFNINSQHPNDYGMSKERQEFHQPMDDTNFPVFSNDHVESSDDKHSHLSRQDELALDISAPNHIIVCDKQKLLQK